ncbi:hypothetical protein MT356_06455 [Rathayibacter festucae]|uniref:hypothetical protein n=1 Tax=Rathayibacter festucae TaxID=110937 RepID=UPI001FB2302B|nr:hypothetical protein [Rathayibacter festucae]MCJ1699356.1 hypothetical protein [Rathayibacter festucae]
MAARGRGTNGRVLRFLAAAGRILLAGVTAGIATLSPGGETHRPDPPPPRRDEYRP